MTKYTCERCLKEFSQKSHYDKHKMKKRPCQDNKGKIEGIVENVIIEKKLILNLNVLLDENMKTCCKLGQYFTTNLGLKKKILEFVMNNPDVILEPSVGQGDLIQIIYENNNKIQFDMYEIDTKIKMLDGIPKNVIYGNFLEQDIKRKYKTIIGNPPFVRTTKGNLYIDFIEKCYNLLENDGELVFIVPSDFFKLTSASKLLDNMIANGTFTHIYHPHNEKLFKNASIDIIVFRYCKNNKLKNQVLYNDEQLYINNTEGLITFDKLCNINSDSMFKEAFDIHVGLVSGKESVYKSEKYGNMEVLNGENKLDKYIFIEKFPSNNQEIDTYLLSYKQELIDRKIKKFNDNNWFEWGAPRNIKHIKENIGKECIYIYTLTRTKIIAFKGTVTYFGGSLIILIPKQKINLDHVIFYLNSDDFKSNFMFSGRFKIGHRQISHSYIPKSIKIHDSIGQ
jgi:adenine-specific DNA-methyltransferase